MKDIFNLYINNEKVEFEAEPKFEFRYQQEDFSNPTIIKNSFSKTIKIEGTDNNNKIFGEIYSLDREQLYKFNEYTGVYFNPSKRTPFELYKNGELIESGYMQLTDIAINNNRIVYSITLYGGLGDFFYTLMYNEEGEKKTLADLWYRIGDKETELDFKINKEFVKASWDKLMLGSKGNTINDLIAFAPCYNGLYDDFDNSSILVNTFMSDVFKDGKTATQDGVNYVTYNGYRMARTNREWTEWECRDLRSYMQRPCLKMSKIIDAVCDEYNNGGYKIRLDDTFFNDNNPYYSKAFMALPLLPTLSGGNENTEVRDLYVDTTYYNGTMHIGRYTSTLLSTTYKLGFNGTNISSNTSNNFTFDTSKLPMTTTFDATVNFDLSLVANSLNATMNNSELFLTYVLKDMKLETYRPEYNYLGKYRSITVQAVMYGEGEEIYYSNMVNFTNPVTVDGNTFVSTPDKWLYAQGEEFGNMTSCYGSFKREGTSNSYKWVDNEGKSTFQLNLTGIPKKARMSISLIIQLRYSENKDYNSKIGINQTIFDTIGGSVRNNQGGFDPFSPVKYMVDSYATAPMQGGSSITIKENTELVKSNTTITKKRLLATDYSPCEVFLDYCKLFGLYFVKDINSKTVDILTKNSFYTGNVIDISDRLDMGKEMKIKPYLYETKYYLMKCDENETYYSKKYKNEYNMVYGQKRIDTNYNFNNDVKEVYDGSVYQNAISATDTSQYYRTFFSQKTQNLQCPSWLMSSPKIELYDSVGTNNQKILDVDYPYINHINTALTANWGKKSGYDMFPKTAFYTLDDNSRSLSDISATLLFYNGFKALEDIKGNTVTYTLTDDIYQMARLNDNKMCHLYTEASYDSLGNSVATKYNSLPQFLRYNIKGNSITESFDFGKPKEIYIANVQYGDDATLYDKYWKRYLSDRYNVNTRTVTCNVNLDGMRISQETLRDFYYFNNSIWVINKIQNFLPSSYDTTKVEFVKVNDTYNYTNAIFEYESNTITLNEYDVLLDWDAIRYTAELKSGNAWTSSVGDSRQSISPSSGSEQGVYIIEMATTTNESEIIRKNVYTFTNENGKTVTFNFRQLPSPYVSKCLYGYVYDEETQEPLKDYTLTFGLRVLPIDERDIIRSFSTKTDADGHYELFLGKSFADSGDVSIDNEMGEEVYTTNIDYNSLSSKQRYDFKL